eukprot:1932957-Amphidinium_carterae.1
MAYSLWAVTSRTSYVKSLEKLSAKLSFIWKQLHPNCGSEYNEYIAQMRCITIDMVNYIYKNCPLPPVQ